MLAATDPNLLNCGLTAVADAISYCCKPAVRGFTVRGGEHGCDKCWMPLGSGADFGLFSEVGATFDIQLQQQT